MLTKADARKRIREHGKALEHSLDAAQSQFQVRMCYVNAHDELMELCRKIVDQLEES